MTDLLNLDEIISVKRTVTVRGTEYAIADRTVDQMLNSIAQSRRFQDGEHSLTPEEVLSEMKKTCMSLLPDCPEAVIGGLNLKQMNALIEFASRSDEEVAGTEATNEGETVEPGKVG